MVFLFITQRFAMPWKQFCVSFFILVLNISAPNSVLADRETQTYGKVPDFSFMERNGKEMKLEDLKGNVWIADFVFTRCQGMCPMLTGQMTNLQEKLRDPKIKLVSFSVDPDHDTPKVLSNYAHFYKAEKGKWFFLTGPKVNMWEFITNGFLLGVSQPTKEDLAQGAEPVMHAARFVLVDQQGNIRDYYDSAEPSQMEELIEHAKTLAAGA